MKLLALETATDACSAALLIDGEISMQHRVAPREHARSIMPFCELLLAEAGISLNQLDCIAFGRGPGSFAGVRIATAVAQGLAFACDLPIVPVSTLAALAQAESEAINADHILAVLDARMSEIYVGAYRRRSGIVELIGEEQVCRADAFLLPPESLQGGCYGVGSGWIAQAEALKARLGSALTGVNSGRLPDAGAVAMLGVRGYESGLAIPAEQALPVYLREKVAEKTRDRRGA